MLWKEWTQRAAVFLIYCSILLDTFKGNLVIFIELKMVSNSKDPITVLTKEFKAPILNYTILSTIFIRTYASKIPSGQHW